jgi:hypothetical protein
MSTTESASSLAGYRLVRALGAGSRADVYLGAGTLGPAVLKVYRSEIGRQDIGRELDALGRLSSPHCVRLLDVATGPDGSPIAILDRVSRGSVAHLLRDRELIEAGEAVTLLAPLTGAVAAMHLAGVAHGGIGASSVHLGASGEPVLLGFGHTHLFSSGAPPAGIDAEPGAMGDLDDLASLVMLVVDRVRGATNDARVGGLIEWLRSTVGTRRFEFAAELEARLFSMAEPLPIEFARMPGTQLAVPARIVGGGAGSEPAGTALVAPAPLSTKVFGSDRAEPRRGVPIHREPGTGVLPEWLHDSLMSSPLAFVRSRVLPRLLPALRGVRRPLWVAVGAVALALVLAIALIPAGRPPSSATATQSEESTQRSSGGRGSETKTPVPVVTPKPLPADPVLALPVLLEARNTCVRERSVLCLDAVDEQSSEAFTEDSDLVRRIQGGGESSAADLIGAAAPALVERLGDSALVSLGPHSDPASALMIREKAGWRIRGFLDGKPGKL